MGLGLTTHRKGRSPTLGAQTSLVGLPLNMDGSEGPSAAKVRVFIDQLAEATKLTVHAFDERLTSAAADEQMAQSGLTHKQKKARRDALAAAAILRGFLESKSGEGGITDTHV